MAKFDRLVITGDQRDAIDVHNMARVIIRLARLRLRRASETGKQTADKKEVKR